jgi:MFS family permease
LKAFTEPLRWLGNKDVLCLLGIGGAVYTIQSMIIASQADVFTKTYQLNDLYLGLSFLPTGLGTILGGQFKGWIMDRDMRRAQRAYREKHNLPHDHTIMVAEHPDFPLERARLRWMPYIIAVFIAFTIGYGFSLRTHIAVPLILQSVIGATSAAVLNINTTYVTDLFPGRSASAVALQNLVRCLMGAAGVAAVDPLIDGIGPGFTFLTAAGFVVMFAPLQWVGVRFGAQWREKRAEQERAREKRQDARKEESGA